jgi:glycosyltransferase involved in cell wall biosynthesis
LLIVQTPSFNPNNGGVQRITYNLGKYFTKKGHDVAYFSFAASNHINVKYGKLYCPLNIDTSNAIGYLKGIIHEFQPAVIINQMPYKKNTSQVLFNLENKEIKTYGCIHNSLFNFKSNAKFIVKQIFPGIIGKILCKFPFHNFIQTYHKIKHRKDLKVILKHHGTLILYTPPNYKELQYFLSEDDLKNACIDFMPNPVAMSTKKLPKKEKTILHVGRINNKQKRSDLLLDFWEGVNKQLPDWKFQILGDGPYMQTLKKDLEKRNLSNVEILGYQKPEKYFEKAALFMMPSAYEGFPNTIIEAHSFGCPVLAYDSYAALSWIVNHNKDAILVPAFDSKKLSDSAVELAKHPIRLRQMQEASLENARRFTLEKVGRQWESLFTKNEI